jgi:site-specific DNA-methyltransferase (adenine-specific)
MVCDKIKLYKGDCLEVMKTIQDKSIDAIITDPPYGTTACKWDSVIDFDLMWKQLNRIIKPNGAIVLFGSEPFSSVLRVSNLKNYKYDWIWKKNKFSNHLNAKKQPMRAYENISVFYKKQCVFNRIPFRVGTQKNYTNGKGKEGGGNWGNHYKGDLSTIDKPIKAAINHLEFNSVHPDSKEYKGHSTQKPVDLMEYLIKTYTNENEIVLDFTMGSGSTGVACKNTNRNFIGIEQDENYFNIAQQRIKETEYKLF